MDLEGTSEVGDCLIHSSIEEVLYIGVELYTTFSFEMDLESLIYEVLY